MQGLISDIKNKVKTEIDDKKNMTKRIIHNVKDHMGLYTSPVLQSFTSSNVIITERRAQHMLDDKWKALEEFEPRYIPNDE